MSHFKKLRLSRPDLSVAGTVLCILISLLFADRRAISQTVPEGSQGLLNVSADVEYIGSAACKECHRDQHQSWLQLQIYNFLGDHAHQEILCFQLMMNILISSKH